MIIGAGDMATNIVDQFNLEEQVVQYWDEPREKGETRYGIPVSKIGQSDCKFVSVIGDPRQKAKKILGIGGNPEFINLIGEGCEIVKSVRYGVGNVIQPPTSILSRAQLGDHNLISGGARIGHDTIVGSYCTIGAEAIIAGNCRIGDGVLLGINCTLRPKSRVGHGAIVGAGAVVTKPVPPNTVVVGNPATFLRKLEPW